MERNKRFAAWIAFGLVATYFLLPGHSRFTAVDARTSVVVGDIEYRVEDVKLLRSLSFRRVEDSFPSATTALEVSLSATNRGDRPAWIAEVALDPGRIQSIHINPDPQLDPGESRFGYWRFTVDPLPAKRYKLGISPIWSNGRGSSATFGFRRQWIDLGVH